MWSAVFVFINHLLNALNLWQAGRMRDADKQAGRDEVFNRAQWEVIDARNKANAIKERVRTLSDDELNSLLRRPKDDNN